MVKIPCRIKDYSDFIAGVLCVLIAVTLQTQITLFASPTYLGLRINLTDLVAPFAGLAILVSLLSRQSMWPEWRMNHFYGWIAVIAVLFSCALLNSYFQYGKLSQWALVNKLSGWIILVCIMGIGGWIGTNARQIHLERFIKFFLYFFAFLLVYQVGELVLQSCAWTKPWLPRNVFPTDYLDGLMANRNAYAFLFMTVMAISTCFYYSKAAFIHRYLSYGLFFLLPFFIIFNASRTACLVVLMMIVAIMICHWRQWKKSLRLLLAVVLGVCAFTAIYHDKKEELFYINDQMYDVFRHSEETIKADIATPERAPQHIQNPGDAMRLIILQDAWNMIRKHPVIGSGLGSVFFYQEQTHGKMINVIDSTPLWLLVETGLIGLIIFAVFYVVIVSSVFKSIKTDEEITKTLRLSILFIIGGFTLMCVMHEIMYTRHMWFLIGLGLTLPSRMRQDG